MLHDYIGQAVVVDTDTNYIAIGELVQLDENYIRLVDVELCSVPSEMLKEDFIRDRRRDGTVPNREEAFIKVGRVVAVSRFDKVLVLQ